MIAANTTIGTITPAKMEPTGTSVLPAGGGTSVLPAPGGGTSVLPAPGGGTSVLPAGGGVNVWSVYNKHY